MAWYQNWITDRLDIINGCTLPILTNSECSKLVASCSHVGAIALQWPHHGAKNFTKWEPAKGNNTNLKFGIICFYLLQNSISFSRQKQSKTKKPHILWNKIYLLNKQTKPCFPPNISVASLINIFHWCNREFEIETQRDYHNNPTVNQCVGQFKKKNVPC